MSKTSTARSWIPSPRALAIGVPFVFLLLFFMLPFLLVLKISFAQSSMTVPPYMPLWGMEDGKPVWLWTVENYLTIFSDDIYLAAYINSVRVAFFTTLI